MYKIVPNISEWKSLDQLISSMYVYAPVNLLTSEIFLDFDWLGWAG